LAMSLSDFGLATPAHEPGASSIFDDRFVPAGLRFLCDVPHRSHGRVISTEGFRGIST
jgi:hypothetical protein